MGAIGSICPLCNLVIRRGQFSAARKRKHGGGFVHRDCFRAARPKKPPKTQKAKRRQTKVERLVTLNGYTSYREKLFAYADDLRKHPTKAEKRMEKRLLELSQSSQWSVKSQQPLLTWIFDFYLEGAGVLIEVDGSSHDTDEQKSRDEVKEADARAVGFQVVRIRNDEVAGYDLLQLPIDLERGKRLDQWLKDWSNGRRPKRVSRAKNLQPVRLIKKADIKKEAA